MTSTHEPPPTSGCLGTSPGRANLPTQRLRAWPLRLAAALVCLTTRASLAAGIPTEPALLGKALCEAVELETHGLEEMRRLAATGQYVEALAAWRDYKVGQLRHAALGTFNWHGDQRNGRRLAAADLLVGKLDLAAYEQLNPPETSFFIDRYGLRGPVDGAPPIDWLARDGSGSAPCDYANFFFAIPLAVRYWQQGSPVYLRKFFQVAGDFAVRQKALVETLPEAAQARLSCGWTNRAGSALSQSDRVSVLIRILGVLAKSLPDEAPKADWDHVLAPRDAPLKPGATAIVPAAPLAELALSLVNDHPRVLVERYLKAGAVPNQRRAGLAALVLTGTTFPEFRASRPVLAAATEGLADYLRGAVHRDGGMLEQSFNYNLGDAASLTELAGCLEPTSPALAAAMKAQQVACYSALAALANPLGRLPALSSYAPANPPPIWRDAQARGAWLTTQSELVGAWRSPLAAQVSGSLSGSGNPPAFTSIALPFSGYFVQRGGWSWDAPWLFFQGSRPSRGHRTQGHNAVQVIAFGRPLLVTAGVPVYDPGQLPVALRPEFGAINELLGEDSSWKVNTVLVDGSSQQQPKDILQAAPTTTVPSRWYTSSVLDYLEGCYELGYARAAAGSGASHRRQVIFVRDPGLWVLVDTVNATDGKSHEFCQNWIVPGHETNGKVQVCGFSQDQLTLDPAARTVRTADPRGPNLTLIHAGLRGASLRYVHHYGEKAPWRGWFSYGFGALVPAHQLEARFAATGPAALITVIQPRRTGDDSDLVVTDLSPVDNPRLAACRFSLPGDRTVTVQAGDTLALTVAGPAGADGLTVAGREAPGSQAFHRAPDGTTSTVPLVAPATFAWTETPTGSRPRYTGDPAAQQR